MWKWPQGFGTRWVLALSLALLVVPTAAQATHYELLGIAENSSWPVVQQAVTKKLRDLASSWNREPQRREEFRKEFVAVFQAALMLSRENRDAYDTMVGRDLDGTGSFLADPEFLRFVTSFAHVYGPIEPSKLPAFWRGFARERYREEIRRSMKHAVPDDVRVFLAGVLGTAAILILSKAVPSELERAYMLSSLILGVAISGTVSVAALVAHFFAQEYRMRQWMAQRWGDESIACAFPNKTASGSLFTRSCAAFSGFSRRPFTVILTGLTAGAGVCAALLAR